jgi:poly(3-hydroxybutyrate) depolymerase
MKISTRTARFLVAASSLGAFGVACSDATDDGGGSSGSGGSNAGSAGMSAGGTTAGTSGSTSTTSGSPATGGKPAGGGGSTTGGSPGSAGGGTSPGGAGGGAGGSSAGAGGGGAGGGDKSKGCGATSWPMSKNDLTIMVDGKARSYNLKIPDNYDTNKPYRLIVAFHWLNGTAQNVTSGQYYGLLPLSQNSTIFVAPQGINNGWSDSGRSQTKGGQDVAFAQALIEQLKNTLCIDTKRVFAEGFSMGGSMSYALACALGSTLRGIAVHSGGPMSGCVQHDTPVAYFMTHGTNDGVCTYPQYGVPQLEDFAEINGCQSATLPTPNSSAGACIDFPGCSAGYPTRGCIFVGDHVYNPGGQNSWVPGETWKFISQF